jgi:hypothetical protein
VDGVTAEARIPLPYVAWGADYPEQVDFAYSTTAGRDCAVRK